MVIQSSVRVARESMGRLFGQRCFYLFTALLVFIALAPFIDDGLITNLVNGFILTAVVAAVGRSTISFLIALCVTIPAAVLRWLSTGSDFGPYYDLMLTLHALVYVIAIGYMLRYVFDNEVMTSDRLWGAAAAYLMIGVLWMFVYAIVDRAIPSSFQVRGTIATLQFDELLYFTFSTLTTTGFGDIVPTTRLARMAAMFEVVVGQLFLAILIARLVGAYTSPAMAERHPLSS